MTSLLWSALGVAFLTGALSTTVIQPVIWRRDYRNKVKAREELEVFRLGGELPPERTWVEVCGDKVRGFVGAFTKPKLRKQRTGNPRVRFQELKAGKFRRLSPELWRRLLRVKFHRNGVWTRVARRFQAPPIPDVPEIFIGRAHVTPLLPESPWGPNAPSYLHTGEHRIARHALPGESDDLDYTGEFARIVEALDAMCSYCRDESKHEHCPGCACPCTLVGVG